MSKWVAVFLFLSVGAADWKEPRTYSFAAEPIDVIVPCTKKDLCTLSFCLDGIKRNCQGVRRIIVISEKQLTSDAEWFPEGLFPFDKQSIAANIPGGEKYPGRMGWYYQQLLKFYALFVIPGLSSNVLVVDADTVFLNPVTFLNEANAGFYNPGIEYHPPYFEHADRLLPGFERVYTAHSGISHHMLLQRAVLEDLFSWVENYHGVVFWKAFCQVVDPKGVPYSGASEYEIYFNFVFTKCNQVEIRQLKWLNSDRLDRFNRYRAAGYDYVSCHAHMRE